MPECNQCRWAVWLVETEADIDGAEPPDAGFCQPVPHLPPADIEWTRPECFFFRALFGEELRTTEREAEEPDTEPDDLWARAGQKAKSRKAGG